jgi:hypothetical protein
MTPLGFLITLILAVLVLSRSRQMAAVGIIAAVCSITQAQVVNVGFHFTAIRLVLLAGFIRIVARGEAKQFRMNAVDRAVIVCASVLMIIPTLRVGTTEEMVYRLGVLYDVLLSYFVFRCLLRDERDLRLVLAKAPLVIVPFALLMVFESFTGRNLFAVFGGVTETSWIRDAHVRGQGPFRNPIIAGAFGATFAMLFASVLFSGTRSRSALVGLGASTLIVLCSRSSGPFLGVVLGLLAFGCWHFRRHTREILWGIVAVLVGLQFVMKVPVWFLMDRVSDLVGGGGYHRAYLIDQAVRYFNTWWLAGTSNTAYWFPYQLPDGNGDITNLFVASGVDAGLVGVIVSIVVVVSCFRRLGVAMKANRGPGRGTQKMLWGIGSTLVCNIGILFSTTYMDQMQVIWYFLLACIAGVELRMNQFEHSPGGRTAREQPARHVPQSMPGLNLLPKSWSDPPVGCISA